MRGGDPGSRWFEIRWEIELGSGPAGRSRVYVDGALDIDATGSTIAPAGIPTIDRYDTFQAGLTASRETSLTTINVDDVTIERAPGPRGRSGSPGAPSDQCTHDGSAFMGAQLNYRGLAGREVGGKIRVGAGSGSLGDEVGPGGVGEAPPASRAREVRRSSSDPRVRCPWQLSGPG